MHFHLAHIVPGSAMHGLHGYKEIIDTVEWGLVELGHSVSYGLNEFSDKGRNIIFGAQMLELSVLEKLPGDTIVYNFEQGRNVPVDKVRPQLRLAAKRFEIWEYSDGNMQVWEQLGALRAEHVPVGYAPVLQRIPRVEEPDIDVLMYGHTGNARVNAFHHLCHAGLTSVFVCGMYGHARDELIGRSKIIVNLSGHESSKIFEIVRVSYLMANRKAIVADVDADAVIEPDVAAAIRIAHGNALVAACRELASDRAARERLEEAAFRAISRRDIRHILAEVVD